MNHFKYQNTVIVQSELDFTRVKKPYRFTGDGNLSTSVGVPKDLEKNKRIKCIVELNIGGDNESVKIFVKTTSLFEIETPIDPDTLRKDAEEFCLVRAVEELSKKTSALTKLHLGIAVNIPVPQLTE